MIESDREIIQTDSVLFGFGLARSVRFDFVVSSSQSGIMGLMLICRDYRQGQPP